MELALIVLLTGVVVVFTVLIILIFIVKIYSTIVYNATQKSKQKKEAVKEIGREKVDNEEKVVEIVQPDDDDSIPDEVIAVIAAAVSSMYGSKAPKIKSVKRSSASRSAWGNAGLLENTRPF